MQLSAADQAALVAFLRSLTDVGVARQAAPAEPPLAL